MKTLRARCPWDRQQDEDSLRQYLLEETYEALHALDERNYDALSSELGDLLLQIVFLCEIAEEQGRFTICDVIEGINAKLVRRHPHVFAHGEARTAEEVLNKWETIKTEQEGQSSQLDGVPAELPALLKAARVLQKIGHAGIDPFEGRDPAAAARQSLSALAHLQGRHETARAETHAADLLLAAAGLCICCGVNPEDVLRCKMHAVIKAFQALEERLRDEGRDLQELEPSERALEARRLFDVGPPEPT